MNCIVEEAYGDNDASCTLFVQPKSTHTQYTYNSWKAFGDDVESSMIIVNAESPQRAWRTFHFKSRVDSVRIILAGVVYLHALAVFALTDVLCVIFIYKKHFVY